MTTKYPNMIYIGTIKALCVCKSLGLHTRFDIGHKALCQLVNFIVDGLSIDNL